MKELPKKWCVKRTIENSEILNKWNNNHPLYFEQHRSYASSICDDDYFYSDRDHISKLESGYTLISFEDFETLVLGKPSKPKPKEDYTYLIGILQTINK